MHQHTTARPQGRNVWPPCTKHSSPPELVALAGGSLAGDGARRCRVGGPQNRGRFTLRQAVCQNGSTLHRQTDKICCRQSGKSCCASGIQLVRGGNDLGPSSGTASFGFRWRILKNEKILCWSANWSDRHQCQRRPDTRPSQKSEVRAGAGREQTLSETENTKARRCNNKRQF